MKTIMHAAIILGLGLVTACLGANGVQAQQNAFDIPEGWTVSLSNKAAPGTAGYLIRHQTTGLELVYVPAATFKMGTTDDEALDAVKKFGVKAERLASEKPAHDVQLSGYWIGRTEVTVGQWRQVMEKMPPPDDGKYDRNTLGDDHPVIWVTWDDANEFCRKLGLRLPTEAEWEYAARGPERHIFPWGNEWDRNKCCNAKNQLWTNGAGFRTFPVGSFPVGASWCGALDMAGNVWEWTNDFFDDGYYSQSTLRNPGGPAQAPSAWKIRSVRGGGYGSDGPHNFRSAYRVTGGSEARQMGYGFRCAL